MYTVTYARPSIMVHVDPWVESPRRSLMTAAVTASDDNGNSACVIAAVDKHFDSDGSMFIQHLQEAVDEAIEKLRKKAS